MTEALHPLQIRVFKTWLQQNGWRSVHQGDAGEVFRYRSGDAAIVAVPSQLGADKEIARGVAVRVAEAMGRDPRDTFSLLASPLTDRIDVRLQGDRLNTGQAPLGAAAEALSNSRRLLSSSGTSALAPGWSVARRYRPEAQKLARETLLEHTRDGSFVFPLLVPLGRDLNDVLFEDSEIKVEPYERRVTRTLATGLATTASLSRDLPSDLSDHHLTVAASLGVTREMCLSLDRLLVNPSVEQVEISFGWSPAFGSTDSLPQRLKLDQGERAGWRQLAKRLKREEPVTDNVFSGPIRTIGYTDDDSAYEITIDTTHKERSAYLRVRLSPEEHERALAWYQERATVVVQGTVVPHRGFIKMEEPARIEGWTDALF